MVYYFKNLIKYGLPLYPSLNPASRHDSISLIITLRDFSQRYNLSPIERILLEAAHDAKSIYEVLDKNDIEAFIDLNPRTKHNYSTDYDISISIEGIPICSKGIPMKKMDLKKLKIESNDVVPLQKEKLILVTNRVLQPFMVVLFIHHQKIICVYLLKHPEHQISGIIFTKDVLLSKGQTNVKKLITN